MEVAMEIKKLDLGPGIRLTAVSSDKFKSSRFSVSLLTALNSETVNAHALIPRVLLRGSKFHRDMTDISRYSDELYGLGISSINRKYGEKQSVGLTAYFTDAKYLPSGTTDKIIDFIFELLLQPATKGGLFLPEYVESEKEKHIDALKSIKNNKELLAYQGFLRSMFEGEAYALNQHGDTAGCEKLNYISLSKAYKNLLTFSQVELFYCGSLTSDELLLILRMPLSGLPRARKVELPETRVLYAPPRENVNYRFERADTTQGILYLGFRIGEYFRAPDLASLRVFNTFFGTSISSRLFKNVREKLSLCYEIYSCYDRFKGSFLIYAGIDFGNYELAREAILDELKAVARGEFTDEELYMGKKVAYSDLLSAEDSAKDMENFFLGMNLSGKDAMPHELASACLEVGRDDVIKIASGLLLDTVYFMTSEVEECDRPYNSQKLS